MILEKISMALYEDDLQIREALHILYDIHQNFKKVDPKSSNHMEFFFSFSCIYLR